MFLISMPSGAQGNAYQVSPKRISEARQPREDVKHLATNQVVPRLFGRLVWNGYAEYPMELGETLAM